MRGQAVVAVRTQHRARPGRRAIVVADLANLRGPVHGTIGPPPRLFWSSADRRLALESPLADAIHIRPCCTRRHGGQTSRTTSTAAP